MTGNAADQPPRDDRWRAARDAIAYGIMCSSAGWNGDNWDGMRRSNTDKQLDDLADQYISQGSDTGPESAGGEVPPDWNVHTSYPSGYVVPDEASAVVLMSVYWGDNDLDEFRFSPPLSAGNRYLTLEMDHGANGRPVVSAALVDRGDGPERWPLRDGSFTDPQVVTRRPPQAFDYTDPLNPVRPTTAPPRLIVVAANTAHGEDWARTNGIDPAGWVLVANPSQVARTREQDTEYVTVEPDGITRGDRMRVANLAELLRHRGKVRQP